MAETILPPKTVEEAMDIVLTELLANNRVIYFKDDSNPSAMTITKLLIKLNFTPNELTDLCWLMRELYYITFQTEGITSANVLSINLSIKGRFFIENRGFLGRKDIEDRLRLRVESAERENKTLTLILALGTGALALIEILKFLMDYW